MCRLELARREPGVAQLALGRLMYGFAIATDGGKACWKNEGIGEGCIVVGEVHAVAAQRLSWSLPIRGKYASSKR